MLVLDDDPQVREQLTERPQRSSPTGRVAACQPDIELVRRSQAFIEIMQQVDRVSSTNSPVLLIGESGIVKELVASAIHHSSSLRSQSFVAVNCAAISPDLIEAELFGQVEGGTIFLDEITETTSSFQETLLHLLQTSEIRRVGSDETRRVDIRVIAGSDGDVEQDVTAGKLRNDLFYFLNSAKITLPPVHAESESAEDWVTLSEIEGRYVARVLEHTRGNKQAAARVLSVDRKTLDRMIKRHHIISQHTRGPRAKASHTA